MIENITNTFLTAKKINDERTNHTLFLYYFIIR